MIGVPNYEGLKKEILSEAHHTRYVVRPDNTKMYINLRENYWWNGMKGEFLNLFQSV